MIRDRSPWPRTPRDDATETPGSVCPTCLRSERSPSGQGKTESANAPVSRGAGRFRATPNLPYSHGIYSPSADQGGREGGSRSRPFAVFLLQITAKTANGSVAGTDRRIATERAGDAAALVSSVSDGAPEAFGGGGHLDVADAEGRERVDERVGDRRHRTHRPGLARTLDAQRDWSWSAPGCCRSRCSRDRRRAASRNP